MSHCKSCLQCGVQMIMRVAMGLLFTISFHFYIVWVELHNLAPIYIPLLLTLVCFVESGIGFITDTPCVILPWMV